MIPRVFHVIRDERTTLLLPRGRKRSFRRALNDVGNAVEFGRLPARPQLVERDFSRAERRGNHRPGAARARKARRLGKRADFDRAGLCARNFIDRMGIIAVNVRLVSRVEDDEGARTNGIVHPFGQLVPIVYRAVGLFGEQR